MTTRFGQWSKTIFSTIAILSLMSLPCWKGAPVIGSGQWPSNRRQEYATSADERSSLQAEHITGGGWNWEVTNVDLNGHGNYVEVAPSEGIAVSLDYHIWDSSCPSCIRQIVVGLDSEAKYCAYNGIPGVYPGQSGSDSDTITAPSTTGAYSLIAANDAQYSCNDAMNRYPQQTQQTTIGTIVVTSGGPLTATVGFEGRSLVYPVDHLYDGMIYFWDITVRDAANLGAYQFRLTWDSARYNIVYVYDGGFLGSTGRSVSELGPNFGTGEVTFGAYSTGSQVGPSGDGRLARVLFYPKTPYYSLSILRLRDIQLADISGDASPVYPLAYAFVYAVRCFGDLDGDQDIDIVDVQKVAAAFNCTTGEGCYDNEYDFNGDGTIWNDDIQKVASKWNTPCSSSSSTVTTDERELTMSPSASSFRLIPALQATDVSNVFTVNLRIEDASNLGSFGAEVTYDPALVQATGVTLGPFLSSTGRQASMLGPDIDNNGGSIAFGGYTLGSNPSGPSGSGILATISFQAVSDGWSDLLIERALPTDVDGDAQSVGGTFGARVGVGVTLPTVYLPIVLRNR